MIERILQEIQPLQNKYGALECGPNAEWILFKEFKLPPGWDREVTELLIIIPPGYPSTPPDNFFVPMGFKLASGAQVANYTEGPMYLEKQWGQFSYHIDGDWHPAADILGGDNLLSFTIKVLDRLKELN